MVTVNKTFYTIAQKLAMLDIMDQRLENGEARRSIARDLKVQSSQLRKWKAKRQEMKQKLKRNTRATTLHSGRPSCLQLLALEDDLLKFIWDQRERGMAVSLRMVNLRTRQLCGDFRRKTERSQDQILRRFIAANGITHRIHTHQSQECHVTVQNEARNWIENVFRPILALPNRDPRFIINMDQTPVFFSMLPRTTLEAVGARTVNVRVCKNASARITAAVSVTASGDMLSPFLVFKGKPGGRIEKREFPTFHPGGIYCAQSKAWFDESTTLLWIDKVLKPFVATAPDGIQPLLFLDSYPCHKMNSVKNAIEDLGVRVEYIPGGCTGLCQPVDVGIGKPLKHHVRNLWQDWSNEQGHHVRMDAPSRKPIARWVTATLQQLPVELIKNSWRHQPYSYFAE